MPYDFAPTCSLSLPFITSYLSDPWSVTTMCMPALLMHQFVVIGQLAAFLWRWAPPTTWKRRKMTHAGGERSVWGWVVDHRPSGVDFSYACCKFIYNQISFGVKIRMFWPKFGSPNRCPSMVWANNQVKTSWLVSLECFFFTWNLLAGFLRCCREK
jgi:hypothetical protein